MASWLQCKLFILLMLLQGCSSLDDINLEARVSSHHLGYQQGVKLDTLFLQEQHDTSQHTGFYSLDKGHDAFLARLMLIESAEKTLDLQYYIYRNDETSQLITWSLYRAAERGVRVRLLLDDMQKRDDHGMAMLDAHTNIEIRLFNPHQYRGARGIAMLSDFSRLTRRMHNKSLTADSVASIVGGRNIGNEYFSFSSNVEFGDFDLLLYGNTVAQTANQFDLYWNSQHAIPINMMNPNVAPITSEQVQAWLVQSQLHSQFTKGRYNLTQLDFYRALQQKNSPLIGVMQSFGLIALIKCMCNPVSWRII